MKRRLSWGVPAAVIVLLFAGPPAWGQCNHAGRTTSHGGMGGGGGTGGAGMNGGGGGALFQMTALMLQRGAGAGAGGVQNPGVIPLLIQQAVVQQQVVLQQQAIVQQQIALQQAAAQQQAALPQLPQLALLQPGNASTANPPTPAQLYAAFQNAGQIVTAQQRTGSGTAGPSGASQPSTQNRDAMSSLVRPSPR